MPFEVRVIDSPSPPLIATPERWIVVAALAVLLAVCHGLITSGLTIFDRSIINDLGISRGELKLRDVFQVATGGFWALGIGIVADRIGPTRIIYAGLVVFAVALLAYGSVTDVGEIYALHVVLAFSYSSCHTVVVVLILTRLFNIGIGPALGVVLAGESLGGTIFPQILVRLIDAEGWRPAMRTLAVLPVLMLAFMPWVLRWVPERRLAAAPTTEGGTARLSVLRFIFQRDVLLLYAAGAALYYAGGGFFAHAFLNFQDRGFAPQAAASCVSLLFITAFAGKGLSGFLAERLGPYRTWLSLQGIFLAGGLLYTLSNAPLVWLGVVLVGVGWGGCYTVTQAVMTTRFVGPSLGRLTGVAVLAEGLAGGLGSWLTGVGFDVTGSYQWPFIGLCLSVGLAIALAASLAWRLRPARLATG